MTRCPVDVDADGLPVRGNVGMQLSVRNSHQSHAANGCAPRNLSLLTNQEKKTKVIRQFPNGLAQHGPLVLCSGRGIGCVSLRRADWIAFHEYSTCCRHNQGFRVLRFSPLSVRARRNTRLCSRGHGLFRIQLAVRGPRLALRGGSASLKMANPLSTTKVQINPKS